MSYAVFTPAEILLPDFGKTDGEKWSVIACDQFTSEPAYWESVSRFVGNAPSTLRMILPEVYLSEAEARIPSVHAEMEKNIRDTLVAHPDCMIYLERTQSDGHVRRGIIGKIDLEAYDYRKGAASLIRATEGTVLSRIPPRVAVRRHAALELPHVMLLIDDRQHSVIEPLKDKTETLLRAYDFPLMLGGGHVTGYFLNHAEKMRIQTALSALIADNNRAAGNDTSDTPLLFAVGDGNHSLATAKAAYEEIKAQIGENAAACHPARYALCEIVNLHDPALNFEPIYRVLFHIDPDEVMKALADYEKTLAGNGKSQSLSCIYGDVRTEFRFRHPSAQLTVGTLQNFIDIYLAAHPEAAVDYIHDETAVAALAQRKNAIGFLFDGMKKEELFPTVICDGALPRKTFSMGHARDKRYYIECRKII